MRTGNTTGSETFRAPPLKVRTPPVEGSLDGDDASLIVTRQAEHCSGPVWLTWHGSWRLTMCLTDEEAAQLVGYLVAARKAGGCCRKDGLLRLPTEAELAVDRSDRHG